MNAWRNYWQAFGVPYGLFQALMVTLWVVSGVGLLAGLLWMSWPVR